MAGLTKIRRTHKCDLNVISKNTVLPNSISTKEDRIGRMEIAETVSAFGHEQILATHKTTLEITKETQLSKRGDCIIAVSADKSMPELSPEFKEIMRRNHAEITILVEAGGVADIVNAFGSSKLILKHPTDMVVRKSSYICSRTLAIKADKAARDLSRQLVEKLRSTREKIKITLKAKVQ